MREREEMDPGRVLVLRRLPRRGGVHSFLIANEVEPLFHSHAIGRLDIRGVAV